MIDRIYSDHVSENPASKAMQKCGMIYGYVIIFPKSEGFSK